MLNIERDIVVMSFGALIVLAGLALMFYGKSAGNSRIKFANMEFEISTPALVVFLVGCGLFLLPLLLPLQRVGFDGRSVVQPLHFQGASRHRRGRPARRSSLTITSPRLT